MNCDNCRKEIPTGANYCPYCGGKVFGISKTFTKLFLKKTQSALDCYKENRIESRAFEIRDDDVKAERCILVMGLNPAGDEEDAARGRTDRTYFCHLDSRKGFQNDWCNNHYFQPIFRFVEKTAGPAKWPWCNKKWSELEEEIGRYTDLHPIREIIKKNYYKNRGNEYTIYIGDMFYYHETKSEKLPLRKNVDFHRYAREMLKLHIDCLRKHNKKIEYVYINNAKVSHWLCGENIKTHDIIDGVPVYYGASLSGMMDVFSKRRLEEVVLHRNDERRKETL